MPYDKSKRRSTSRQRARKLDDVSVQEIVDAYEKGVTVTDIAAEWELDVADVRMVLNRMGADLPNVKQSIVSRMDEATIEQFLDDYYNKRMLIREMVVKYDLSDRSTVFSILQRLNKLPRSATKDVVDGKGLMLDHACALYKDGHPLWKIYQETGVQGPDLYSELRIRKIPLRNRGRYRTAVEDEGGMDDLVILDPDA